MCGIISVYSKYSDVNQKIYDGLTMLQHRGQDAAGICTYDGEKFHIQKNNGTIREAIRTRHMLRLVGNMGIGHTRYPTAGSESEFEAQPFLDTYNGIALAHNGNIVNAQEIRAQLKNVGVYMETESDSELILKLFARLINPGPITKQSVTEVVAQLALRLVGSYSCVLMIDGFGLVAFRDPLGIRPLEYGFNKNVRAFASESVAFDVMGLTSAGPVPPGQVIFVDLDGMVDNTIYSESAKLTPCIFEYVYLARPDSKINKVSVFAAREYMGKSLAKYFRNSFVDCIVPVPDTGIIPANALAAELGKPVTYALVKNRYIPRTFIMPGNEVRESNIKLKMNVIRSALKDKHVVLVDDSIVRGTTSKRIIDAVREAGPASITFASISPPVLYQNVLGIDISTIGELAAHKTDDICKYIGADRLVYQTLEDLEDAVGSLNPDINGFESSVFNGVYPDRVSDYLDIMARRNKDR